MSATAATARSGPRAVIPRPRTSGADAAARLPELRRREPLAPLTTIRVGGPADWLCRARSTRAVAAALAWARERAVPVAVVGKGSNLIVSDEGFRGLALLLAGPLQGISVRGGGAMW